MHDESSEEFEIDPEKASEIATEITDFASRMGYIATNLAAACQIILKELSDQGIEVELLPSESELH